MAEAIVEPIVDVVVEKEEPAAPIIEESPPEVKKKGRPAGAKDRAPRKKKITVVEEPLEVEPPPKVRVKAPVASEPETPKLPRHKVAFEVPLEPPSPRTQLREATKHVMNVRMLSESARKAHLQELYTKKLHSF